MRHRLLAVAFLCAAATSVVGCMTMPSAPAATTPAQAAARAMLTAETAFNIAATAQLDAKATGLLAGEKADKADQIRKDAYKALLRLREIYDAGGYPDATTLLQLTNQLLVLAGQPPAVIPNIPTL